MKLRQLTVANQARGAAGSSPVPQLARDQKQQNTPTNGSNNNIVQGTGFTAEETSST
jgi:hypothetical protein